jgi:hypothetical protein
MTNMTTITDTYLTRLHRAGFTAEETSTGGGCTAIGVTLPQRWCILITDEDASVPDSLDYCCIGIYDEGYGYLGHADATFSTMVEAVRALMDEHDAPDPAARLTVAELRAALANQPDDAHVVISGGVEDAFDWRYVSAAQRIDGDAYTCPTLFMGDEVAWNDPYATGRGEG